MRKLSKTLLSLLLIAAMLASFVVLPAAAEEPAAEQPTEAVQAAETQAADSSFMKIFHLDCGRKYFTKDWILALINEISAAGYTHLQLALGNDGMRFLLDDMSLTVGDKTYSSEDVAAAIHAGNEKYHDFTVDELTEKEMDAIIAHAKEKNIEILPLINTPGHMDAILDAAAVTYTIENLAQAGDHIVSAKNIYGGTYNLLAHTLVDFGVTTTFVDPFNLEEVEGAIKDNTKAVYIETLGNPNSEVVDIEALAEIAHKHKIPLVIDNTFGTPYLIRPIEYGADIVVHSATKFIGGHGTTIGGVIIDGGKFDWAASGKFPQLTEPNPSYHGVSFAAAAGPAAFVTRIRAILLRDTGATLSPIHAFIFLQGLETLSLRVERHVENALKVVEFLEKQPLVEKVNHPSVSEDPEQQRLYKKYFPNGGGSIFTFEIKGDDKKAQEFIDHLQLFSLLANVADVKSLVIHPASTTHAELNEAEQAEQGIKPNTIRLSIGTENIDDILYDLQEAFDAVK